MSTKTVPAVLGDLAKKVANTWAATLVAQSAGTPGDGRKDEEASAKPDPANPADGPPDLLGGDGIEPRSTTGTDTTGEGTTGAGATHEPPTWPLRLYLGKPPKAHLSTNWPLVQRWAIDWRDWATQHHLHLDWANRITDGIRQSLPTHLTIPDLDTAARLLGGDWPTRLDRARKQLHDLHAEFPHAATPRILTALERLTDDDYTLLLVAARWFTHHDATGLTPRQVPLEGVHGKWLNAHHRLIETLAGKPDLGLTDRPTRIHFTYLDPHHLADGGRLHDSHTLGDTSRPAYQPKLVIIAENKDTAILFPALDHAISVEGNGNAGPTLITQLDWVHAADRIIYWGDIDAAGYDIVHRYRTHGLPIETILMDDVAYETYETYGTWTDEKNNPITCSPRRPLDRLTPTEQVVYEHLTDPDWPRVRRIEQERIPLTVAHQRLLALTRTPMPDTVRTRLTGYLPDALGHMLDAAHNADATFDWPTSTQLSPAEVLDHCVTETTGPEHGLLLHFDTAAAVLLTLGIDPEEAAHCLAAHPLLRPTHENDLVAGETFMALLHAGLTGTDAAAAAACNLTPDETLAVVSMQGPGYLTSWQTAGYGEPELRNLLPTHDLPPIEDIDAFAALRSNDREHAPW